MPDHRIALTLEDPHDEVEMEDLQRIAEKAVELATVDSAREVVVRVNLERDLGPGASRVEALPKMQVVPPGPRFEYSAPLTEAVEAAAEAEREVERAEEESLTATTNELAARNCAREAADELRKVVEAEVKRIREAKAGRDG